MEEVPNDMLVMEEVPNETLVMEQVPNDTLVKEQVPNDVVVVMEEVPNDVVPEEIFVNEIMPCLGTTKEVIRTMVTVSKRWSHLWTHHPDLIFSSVNDLEGKEVTATVLHDYFSFIHNTIKHTMNTIKQCPTDLNLKNFKLWITYSSSLVNSEFESRANGWIGYAIKERNVEEVDLWLLDAEAGVGQGFTFANEDFFNNSCITRMTLASCLFNPPNGAIRWERLESLCLFWVPLDEDMMKKIFSGCPCLKSLELENCRNYRQIDITSESVKKLVFSRFQAGGVVKSIAPNISSLTIKGMLSLQQLALDDVCSLNEAELDYFMHPSVPLETHEQIFKGLLESLCRVKDVIINDYYCLEIYNRLKARGVTFNGCSVKPLVR